MNTFSGYFFVAIMSSTLLMISLLTEVLFPPLLLSRAVSTLLEESRERFDWAFYKRVFAFISFRMAETRAPDLP